MLVITRFGIIKIEGVKVIRNFTIDFENIAMILLLLIIPNVLDESISKYLKNDNIYNI